jgi:hypothetical protein
MSDIEIIIGGVVAVCTILSVILNTQIYFKMGVLQTLTQNQEDRIKKLESIADEFKKYTRIHIRRG